MGWLLKRCYRILWSVFLLLAVLSSEYATAEEQVADTIISEKLTSSVMWQLKSKHVYFPGIFAVLYPDEPEDRLFRIELYFSEDFSGKGIQAHVQGSWAETPAHKLKKVKTIERLGGKPGFENTFMSITETQCESEDTIGEEGESLGYRCLVEFYLAPSVPTGTVGVSLSLRDGEEAVSHPNMVYLVTIPERIPESAPGHTHAETEMGYLRGGPDPSLPRTEFGLLEQDETGKNVVQITFGGSLSLGSGFLTHDIMPVQRLFFSGLDELGGVPEGYSTGMYVVTAAHLFPIPYHEKFVNHAGASFLNRFDMQYDLVVNGVLVRNAGRLYVRDISTDVAILVMKDDAVSAILEALGVSSLEGFKGLEVAPGIALADKCGEQGRACGTYRVFGYPVSGKGRLERREGVLYESEYPTDNTSNFGNVKKFKLEPKEDIFGKLAEAGLSGGPIIGSDGKVVGVATERPTGESSLIAIDITSQAGEVALTYSEDCNIQFNPFDRVFHLVNDAQSCDYGKFGSKELANYEPLAGEWVIQEVLGVKSRSEQSQSSGHQLINGQVIINGIGIIAGLGFFDSQTIIDGKRILRKKAVGDQESIPVLPENLKEINETLFADGYHFNVDSFQIFEPTAVRILKRPLTSTAESLILGQAIVGLKESATDRSPKPVNSIRHFVIWLHDHAYDRDFHTLVETK